MCIVKISKKQLGNIIFVIIIAILIIPQTRQPIQIFLHKGLALFSPSIIDEESRTVLSDYNWELIDEDGHPYNFNDAKGKVVLVNFWATWCPPCIAEMPSLEKLYQRYKGDVIFLLVSEEKKQFIYNFKEKHDYDFKVYSSITKHPEIFETQSIPRTYILDKNGSIVIDKSGAANWYSESVKELLDNLISAQK